MKRRFWVISILMVGLWSGPASAQGLLGGLLTNVSQTLTSITSGQQQGVIVRTNKGLLGLQNICLFSGCSVTENLDGGQGQVFLVQPVQGLLPNLLASVLRLVNGILDAEVDQGVQIPMSPNSPAIAGVAPSGLWDSYPVNFYGTTVWEGYSTQPATQIIRVTQAQSTFNVLGAGTIVTDIDTGVDPTHPALQGVLLPGYDFTRNQPGASELNDPQPSNNGCSSCPTVNSYSVARPQSSGTNQSSAALVDGDGGSDFGHGTMVVGIIHLTAPKAMILPLKAFQSDGTGNLSDILRAIYYAVQNHTNVINMSFDLTSPSTELNNAINYAASNNVILVASAGNDGKEEVVYPAGLQNVMGVASTNDLNQRSSFSNYGNQVVWVAAPGEAIVTTYPFGGYSAGWGTSFSAPFVSGTAALLVNSQASTNQSRAAADIAHAVWVGPNMGNGRLDVVCAVQALTSSQGCGN
ncbi:MAG TPA: S8 family serine peptidase [Candidatus Acidoferrum sp.]|nr:S8 family serine peptidase [Candidatus Acidoferrum sp.]